MEKNNMKLIGVFASVLLLVIIVTASFAYFGSFNVNLNNNVAVNVNSVSPGDATFTSNATQLNLQVPAANMSQTASNNELAAATNTATLTVNLTGAANLLTTCTYDIVYEYDSTSNVYGKSPTTKNGDKEITLQVSNVNGTNNFASEKNFDSVSMANYYNSTNKYYTLVSGASISSMGTLKSQNISITAKYYNLDIPQTSLEGSAFTGKIYVTNHKCETSELPGYYTILANNGGKEAIKAKGTPDFKTAATTNEGMYATQDDLGTSYYFRGAVNNNWVKFGKDGSDNDIYWRIIRINGDGSIRMIYSGTTPPISSTATVMTGTGTQIGTSVFNNKYNNPSYVGFMYGDLGTQHDNTTESSIKKYIDNWFGQTTLNTDVIIKNLLSDQIFCNDRMLEGNINNDSMNANTSYTFAAYGDRTFANKGKPSLKCYNEKDRFTVTNNLGNGSLTNPVGLITSDEINMAGALYNNANCLHYLCTSNTFWVGTPYIYISKSNMATTFAMYVNGSWDSAYVNSSYGVRPVISLSSSVKLSGSGTYNDVYTVS